MNDNESAISDLWLIDVPAKSLKNGIKTTPIPQHRGGKGFLRWRLNYALLGYTFVPGIYILREIRYNVTQASGLVI